MLMKAFELRFLILLPLSLFTSNDWRQRVADEREMLDLLWSVHEAKKKNKIEKGNNLLFVLEGRKCWRRSSLRNKWRQKKEKCNKVPFKKKKKHTRPVRNNILVKRIFQWRMTLIHVNNPKRSSSFFLLPWYITLLLRYSQKPVDYIWRKTKERLKVFRSKIIPFSISLYLLSFDVYSCLLLFFLSWITYRQ